jgi:hypothetical protein
LPSANRGKSNRALARKADGAKIILVAVATACMGRIATINRIITKATSLFDTSAGFLVLPIGNRPAEVST